MNADPRCTCPHDAFNVARDAQCPVHGTPTVVTDSRQPLGECLHTEVRDTPLGWTCDRCGAITEL